MAVADAESNDGRLAENGETLHEPASKEHQLEVQL